MSSNRASRALRLELLRARAAADRMELALALHDISDRVSPLRRVVDSIGFAAGMLGGRGRALSWVAAALALLARGRWLRQVVAGSTAKRRSGSTSGVRSIAVAALVAAALRMLIRRARR